MLYPDETLQPSGYLPESCAWVCGRVASGEGSGLLPDPRFLCDHLQAPEKMNIDVQKRMRLS